MFSNTTSAVTKHLTTAANKAKTKGEEIGENLDKGLTSKLPKISGTAKRIGGLLFGFLTGAFAAGGISRALNIEDAQAKLKGLGHDAETITTIMGNASASVKGTAFGLGDAATVAAGAVAAGIQPGKDLERVLSLTGDAATIAGKDLSEMGSIFNKVAASGKLQGDVIAQLQDAGVPILQFVAKEIGKTAAETSKLASEGKIDFATFTTAMEKGLGGAAKASGDTFRGSMKNLMAAFSRISETALTPFLGLVKDGANSLIPLLDGVNAGLKPIMAGIVEKITAIKDAVTAGGSASDIAAALGFSPAAVDRISAVAGAVSDFYAGLTLGKPEVESLNGELGGMVAVGVKVREFFDKLFESLGPVLPQLGELALAASPVLTIFEALLPVLPTLIETATALGGALSGVLGGALAVVTPILEGVLSVVGFLLTKITETEGGTAALVGVILTVTGAILAYKAAVAVTSGVMRAYAAITGTVRALKAGYAAASYGAAAASYVEGRAGKAGVVVWYAKAAALKVATAAAKIASLTMRGLGAAVRFATGPVGLIITGISLLVAGLVWFFTQTETGKAIVENVWTGIKTAIAAVVDWWNGTLMPALQAVGDFFAEVWGWISRQVESASLIIQAVAKIIVDFWNAHIVPALQWLGDLFATIWGGISAAVEWAVGLIMAGVGLLVDFWNAHVAPALQWLGDLFATIWGGIVWAVQTYIGIVQAVIQGLVDFWNGVLAPAISTVAEWFSEKLSPAIDAVGGFIDNVKNGFQTFVDFVRDKVQPIVDGLKDAFGWLGEKIGDVMGHLGDFAGDPLGGLRGWAEGVLGGEASGGGVFYSGGGVAQFAGGGVLGGYRPGRDTIPAILSPGESVLVPELTRAIGPANIMAANRAASGGRPAGGGPSLLSGHSGGTDVLSLGLTGASGGYAPVSAPSRPLAAAGAPAGGPTVVIEKVEVNLSGGSASGGGISPEDVTEAVEEAIEKAIDKAFTKARKRGY